MRQLVYIKSSTNELSNYVVTRLDCIWSSPSRAADFPPSSPRMAASIDGLAADLIWCNRMRRWVSARFSKRSDLSKLASRLRVPGCSEYDSRISADVISHGPTFMSSIADRALFQALVTAQVPEIRQFNASTGGYSECRLQ